MTERKKTKTKTMIYINITQKTKNRETRTPLKPRGELSFSGIIGSSCSTCHTRRVALIMYVLHVGIYVHLYNYG